MSGERREPSATVVSFQDSGDGGDSGSARQRRLRTASAPSGVQDGHRPLDHPELSSRQNVDQRADHQLSYGQESAAQLYGTPPADRDEAIRMIRSSCEVSSGIVAFNSGVIVKLWGILNTVLLPVALLGAALLRPNLIALYYLASFFQHMWRWKANAPGWCPGKRDLAVAFLALGAKVGFNIALLVAKTRTNVIGSLDPEFWDMLGVRQPHSLPDALLLTAPEFLVMTVAGAWVFLQEHYAFVVGALRPSRSHRRNSRTIALFVAIIMNRCIFLACLALSVTIPSFLTIIYLVWCLYFAFRLSVLHGLRMPRAARSSLRDLCFVGILTLNLILLYLSEFPFLPTLLPHKLYQVLGLVRVSGFPTETGPDGDAQESEITYPTSLLAILLTVGAYFLVIARDRLVTQHHISTHTLHVTDFTGIFWAVLARKKWTREAQRQARALRRNSTGSVVRNFLRGHAISISALNALAFAITFPSFLTLTLVIWACLVFSCAKHMGQTSQKFYVHSIHYVLMIMAAHILLQFFYHIPGLFSREFPSLGLVKGLHYHPFPLFLQLTALIAMSTLLRLFAKTQTESLDAITVEDGQRHELQEDSAASPGSPSLVTGVPTTLAADTSVDLARDERVADSLANLRLIRKWTTITSEFSEWLVTSIKRHCLEYSYLISLTALFLCSIQQVNAIHAVFMLFFLLFILFPTLARERWRLLVFFTELVILAQFALILPPLRYYQLPRLIGIEAAPLAVMLWDILWQYYAILIISLVQNSAFDLLCAIERESPNPFPPAIRKSGTCGDESAGVSPGSDPGIDVTPSETSSAGRRLLEGSEIPAPRSGPRSNPLIATVWTFYQLGYVWVHENSIFFVYMTHLVTTLVLTPMCSMEAQPSAFDLEALGFVFLCFAFANLRSAHSEPPRSIWMLHSAYLASLVVASYIWEFDGIEGAVARFANLRNFGLCRVTRYYARSAFSQALLRRVWLLLATVFHLRCRDRLPVLFPQGGKVYRHQIMPRLLRYWVQVLKRAAVRGFPVAATAVLLGASIEGSHHLSRGTASFLGLPLLISGIAYALRIPRARSTLCLGILILNSIVLMLVVIFQVREVNSFVSHRMNLEILGFVEYPKNPSTIQSTLLYVYVRLSVSIIFSLSAKCQEWKEDVFREFPHLQECGERQWPLFPVYGADISGSVGQTESWPMAFLEEIKGIGNTLSSSGMRLYGFEMVIIAHLFVALCKANILGLFYALCTAAVSRWLRLSALRSDYNWKIYASVLGFSVLFQYLAAISSIHWPWNSLPHGWKFLLSLPMPPDDRIRFVPDFFLFMLCCLQPSEADRSRSPLVRLVTSQGSGDAGRAQLPTWRWEPMKKLKFLFFRYWIWIVLFVTFISGTVEVTVLAASRLVFALFMLRYGEELILNETIRHRIWAILQWAVYGTLLVALIYQIPAYAVPIDNERHAILQVLGLFRVGAGQNDLPVLSKTHLALWFLYICILIQKRVMRSSDLPFVVDVIIYNYASANERALAILEKRQRILSAKRDRYEAKVKCVQQNMKLVRRDLASINDWVELFGSGADKRHASDPAGSETTGDSLVSQGASDQSIVPHAPHLSVASRSNSTSSRDLVQGQDCRVQDVRESNVPLAANVQHTFQVLDNVHLAPPDPERESHMLSAGRLHRPMPSSPDLTRAHSASHVVGLVEGTAADTMSSFTWAYRYISRLLERSLISICERLKPRAIMYQRSLPDMATSPALTKMNVLLSLLWSMAWSEGFIVYCAVFINHVVRGDIYSMIPAMTVLIVAIPQYPQTSPIVWNFLIVYFEVCIVIKYALTIVELLPNRGHAREDAIYDVPDSGLPSFSDRDSTRWWAYTHFFLTVFTEMIALLAAVIQREMMRFNGLWTESFGDSDLSAPPVPPVSHGRESLASRNEDKGRSDTAPCAPVPQEEVGTAVASDSLPIDSTRNVVDDSRDQLPQVQGLGRVVGEVQDGRLEVNTQSLDEEHSGHESAPMLVDSWGVRRRWPSESSLSSDSSNDFISSASSDHGASRSQRIAQSLKRFGASVMDKAGLLGTDYYSRLFAADLFVFIMTVTFWGAFSRNHDQSLDFLSSLLSENSVSIPPLFLGTLMMNSVIIVCDRVAHVSRSWKFKMALQVVTVVGFHAWLYYLAPGPGSPTRVHLQVWYFFKWVYWFYSAMQLKYGYLTVRVQRSLFKNATIYHKYLFVAFRSIPFVYEIRAMIDWTMTRTTLTFYRWLKLEDIHAQAYCLKCDRWAEKRAGRLFGQPYSPFLRHAVGMSMIVCIIAFLWFPPLFMSIPGTTTAVQIENLRISLAINHFEPFYVHHLDGKEISPFTEERFQDIVEHGSQEDKEAERLRKVLPSWVTQNNLVPIEAPPTSNQPWLITDEAKVELYQTLANRNLTAWLKSTIVLARADNQQPRLLQNSFIRELSDKERVLLLAGLHSGKFLSHSEIDIPRAIPQFIRALPKGSLVDLDPYHRLPEGKKPWVSPDGELRPFMVDLKLRYHPGHQGRYGWVALFDQDGENVKFVIVMTSMPNLPALHGYGIIGLYVVVVLSVGRLLRGFATGIIFQIPFEDLPNVDGILSLCEDIHLAREFQDYFLEEMLYWNLITLFRSPDALIQATTMRPSRNAVTQEENRETNASGGGRVA